MSTDVKDLAGRLRAMNLAQCDDAATALEAQASYIDDVTAEHETAVKQLMREVEIARDMGEINYRKWAEERVRADVQAEEIKRLRQENVGASALEALGLDPSGAFREVVLAMKERAEAAERERDALKVEKERLREALQPFAEMTINGIPPEDDLILRKYPRFASRLLSARAALHPTQGGE